jgi:stage V sporulation protein B
MASYSTAYNVYFWLLVLATAGFPSAIAKLISEKYALGRREEAEAIRRTAVRFSVVAGVASAVLVYWLAPMISAMNGDPDAALAIQALAPALLLFPWIAVERGYFHGRQRMGANGLSQIWEQIFRVLSSVLLAYILLSWGFGIVWAVAGASFGGVVGAVAAAAVMGYYSVKLRREDAAGAKRLAAAGSGDAVSAVSIDAASPDGGTLPASARESMDVGSTRSIFRTILKLSIPVSITALAVPTVNLIDSLITIPLLQSQVGWVEAKFQQGLLQGKGQSLAGIPVIFAIALSQSILPIISAAFAKKEQQVVERQTSQVLRITLLSGVPAIVVIAAVVFPLNTFIFGDSAGSWIIVAMISSVFFQILMMTSGSILLGMSRPDLPLKHIAFGVAVKLILSFALAPFIGIYGIVAATAACFALTMALNLRALRRMVTYTVLGKRAAPFAATVLLQAAIGSAAAWAAYTYVHPFGVSFWDAFLQTAIASLVATVVYPVLLLRTRAFTAADAAALPSAIRKLWNRAEPMLRKVRLV